MRPGAPYRPVTGPANGSARHGWICAKRCEGPQRWIGGSLKRSVHRGRCGASLQTPRAGRHRFRRTCGTTPTRQASMLRGVEARGSEHLVCAHRVNLCAPGPLASRAPSFFRRGDFQTTAYPGPQRIRAAELCSPSSRPSAQCAREPGSSTPQSLDTARRTGSRASPRSSRGSPGMTADREARPGMTKEMLFEN